MDDDKKTLVITLEQLKGLVDYYEMYGVDEMAFDFDHIEDILSNFGPASVDTVNVRNMLDQKPDSIN